MSDMKTTTLLAATALLALSACDDGVTDPRVDEGSVTVAFTAVSAPGATRPAPVPGLARSVAVQGRNGTLVLDELHIVVEEFELKRISDDDCESGDDDCEEFEAPVAFVSVPLDGGSAVAAVSDIAPGVYDELEFEVDDLDDDEPASARLLSEIRAGFPDWPEDASMLVVGSFTPTGGEPRAFRVYLEAEVEVEVDLTPPVTIAGDGEDRVFTVRLDPSRWFTDGVGGVRNLALLDFDTTGRVAELEVEIEDGIVEVEFDG